LWKKKLLLFTFIVALIVPLFFTVGKAESQVANPQIHIRSDGTVDPSSTPISRNGNTYTFTNNITTQGISIEKPDIIIDGAGYTLTGPYNGEQTLWIIGEGPNQTPTNESFSIGIDVVTNMIGGLKVMNLNIKNFSIGMFIWSSNNTIIGNSVSNGIVGIMISGPNNKLTQNYIANNKNGVFFSESQSTLPSNISISDNHFSDNIKQISGCLCIDLNTSEPVHHWDNGSRGNFWSDYNGTDNNGDGIGDTPYTIDALNVDRYPLVVSSVIPPKIVPNMQVEIGITVATLAAIAFVAFVLFRKKKKKIESQDIM
jgi:parallel beta-helix repeat protein